MANGGLAILSDSPGRMSASRRKARYGVAYLRCVCSQAGVPLSETEPDEDVYAIDCRLGFPEVAVPVQVKCTSRLSLRGRTASVQLDPSWSEKWRASCVPVYLVLVIVPKATEAWLRNDPDGTWHATAAYWVRVTGHESGRLSVPKKQRLSAETLREWHNEVRGEFGLMA